MEYMLLLYQTGERPEVGTAESDATRAAMRAYLDDLDRTGYLKASDPLQPPRSATTVLQRDGERLIVDGPFMETKEWLAGYFILDCPDLDTALDLASRCPGCAGAGGVEVRPLHRMTAGVAALPADAAGGGIGAV